MNSEKSASLSIILPAYEEEIFKQCTRVKCWPRQSGQYKSLLTTRHLRDRGTMYARSWHSVTVWTPRILVGTLGRLGPIDFAPNWSVAEADRSLRRCDYREYEGPIDFYVPLN